MEILCPSCEKKLYLKLQPEFHCSLWCGTCEQEVPPETLTDAGAPAGLLARIGPWADRVRDLLDVGDEMAVGGTRGDDEYVREWKALRDETVSLFAELKRFVPVGTKVFGAPRVPTEWSDAEILRWRRQREREGLLHSYGYQVGARYVEHEGGLPLDDGDGLPIPYPAACVTDSEKTRFLEGFILGTRDGSYDQEIYAGIVTRLRGRK
ncbi:MAG: hypothetical protein HYY17_13090 [Planctomycetes bacterium]|nr:hypothetical protein [Planctomycetota bacterium]